MTSDWIVALVGLSAWVVLVIRSLAARRLGWERMVMLALTWAAVFGAGWIVATWFLRVHPITNFT